MNKSTAAIIIVIAIVTGGAALAIYDHLANTGEPERIGIIGAMDEEVNDIKAVMDIQRIETHADMEFCVGTIGGHDVVVVQCGMGKVNAALCTETLISHFNARKIINSGAAGSLDSSLSIGDFIICDTIVQHDFDVSPIGFAPHEIPYTERVFFEADPVLRDAAFEAIRNSAPEASVLTGLICTGDIFVATAEQKDSILADFPAGKCCEMEGGAIAQVCYLHNIPFAVIRAISDDNSGEQFIDHIEEIGRECAQAVVAMVNGM